MKWIYKMNVPFNNNLPLFFRIQYQQQTTLHIFHVDLNAYFILVASGFHTAQQITDAYYSLIVQKLIMTLIGSQIKKIAITTNVPYL